MASLGASWCEFPLHPRRISFRPHFPSFFLDTRQYATWNRTRSIHVPPYLAQPDSRVSRAATAMTSQTQGTILSDITGVRENETANRDKPSKKHDTLFGPNIGIVSSGPEWTEISQDKTVVDELTPEIVKGWVAKSKEVSHVFNLAPYSPILNNSTRLPNLQPLFKRL